MLFPVNIFTKAMERQHELDFRAYMMATIAEMRQELQWAVERKTRGEIRRKHLEATKVATENGVEPPPRPTRGAVQKDVDDMLKSFDYEHPMAFERLLSGFEAQHLAGYRDRHPLKAYSLHQHPERRRAHSQIPLFNHLPGFAS